METLLFFSLLNYRKGINRIVAEKILNNSELRKAVGLKMGLHRHYLWILAVLLLLIMSILLLACGSPNKQDDHFASPKHQDLMDVMYDRLSHADQIRYDRCVEDKKMFARALLDGRKEYCNEINNPDGMDDCITELRLFEALRAADPDACPGSGGEIFYVCRGRTSGNVDMCIDGVDEVSIVESNWRRLCEGWVRDDPGKIHNISDSTLRKDALGFLSYLRAIEGKGSKCTYNYMESGSSCMFLRTGNVTLYLDTIGRSGCLSLLFEPYVRERGLLNSSFCEGLNISDPESYSRCITAITMNRALDSGDTSACRKLWGEGEERCIRYVVEEEQKIAQEIHRIAHYESEVKCHEFTLPGVSKRCLDAAEKHASFRQDFHLFEGVFNSMDPDICRNITTPDIKKACNSIIHDNLDTCLQIDDDQIRIRCIYALREDNSGDVCSSLDGRDYREKCRSHYARINQAG